jgi:hypothetical protein
MMHLLGMHVESHHARLRDVKGGPGIKRRCQIHREMNKYVRRPQVDSIQAILSDPAKATSVTAILVLPTISSIRACAPFLPSVLEWCS